MTTQELSLEREQLKRRGLVNRKPISNAVDLELWRVFNQLSEQTGINKSKLLDQALILLINHYQNYPIIEKSPLIQLKKPLNQE